MSTSSEVTRYELLSIVAARGQEVCVSYVNGQAPSESIEALFGALSKLQKFDDHHADDGPSSPEVVSQQLIEKLAAAEHASWSAWMTYLFSLFPVNEDGSVTITPFRVERWKALIDTPYAAMTEELKQYDRDEVNKIVPLIEAEIASLPKC